MRLKKKKHWYFCQINKSREDGLYKVNSATGYHVSSNTMSVIQSVSYPSPSHPPFFPSPHHNLRPFLFQFFLIPLKVVCFWDVVLQTSGQHLHLYPPRLSDSSFFFFFLNIFSPSCNHRPEVWWYGHILLCHSNIPTIFPLRPIKWCRVTACVSAEVASPWPRMSKTTLIYFLSYLIVLARQTATEVRPRITAGPGSWPGISMSSILVVGFEFLRFVF